MAEGTDAPDRGPFWDEQWPDQMTFWRESDPRRAVAGFRSWLGELRTILVSHAWALSLLHGAHDHFDLVTIARITSPMFSMRAESSPGERIELEVLPHVEALTAAARAGTGPYGSDLAFQLAVTPVLVQLADALLNLQLSPAAANLPIVQFTRHVRNAIAHGSVFDTRPPKSGDWKTAKLGALEITLEHDGHSLWRVIAPGDVLALIDELSQRADQLLPASPGEP